MKKLKLGRIFLESASKEEIRRKLHDYLRKRFKDIPQERINDLLRKTPIVLIDGVPTSKATAILADLVQLGAVARFLPPAEDAQHSDTSANTAGPRDQSSLKGSSSVPFPILFSSTKAVSWKSWLPRLVIYGVLLAATQVFLPKYINLSEVQPIPFLKTWVIRVFYSGQDFKAFQPLTISSPSIMEVPPENMLPAFRAQYRMQPDRRLRQSFEVLTQRYEQMQGRQEKEKKFRVGEIKTNAEWIRIPLLKKTVMPFLKWKTVKEIFLPLPLTFSQTQKGLADWINALAGEEGIRTIPITTGKASPKQEIALQYINQVDPRFILMGLTLLEEDWQGGYREATLFQAAARGYALLLQALFPDVTQANDTFASEALAWLALARWMDPQLPLYREEALLARNMGYQAHSASLMKQIAPDTISLEDSFLDGYLRQDFQTMRRLREKNNPSILGYFLLARLYREIGLRVEAETAASELLRQFPISYPAVIENIYSGDLGSAKVLSILYPLDILSFLEKKVSPESLPKPFSWEDRLKGFSGETSSANISIARVTTLLNQWSPYPQEGNFSFIIDADRVKRIYQTLYLDALYLRFYVLLHRWNVLETSQTYVASLAASDKDHPLILLMQGQTFSQSGNRNSAKTYFERVISHSDAGGFLTYQSFTGLQTPLDKIRLLPSAFARLDSRPEHRFKMGWLFQKDIHNYDLAQQFYTAGLKEDPFQYSAYYSLAMIDGSEEPLLQGLEKYPRSFVLMKSMGEYLAKKDNPESKNKALFFLNKAQELAPSNQTIVSLRAKVLAEGKRYTEAADILTEWINRHPKTDILIISSMKTKRAEMYLKMGRPQKALDSLAGRIDSYKAGVILVKARILEALNHIDQAAEIYQAAIDRYPMGISVLAQTAGFYWRNQKHDLAAQVIAKGRSIVGPFSQWYFQEFLEGIGQTSNESIFQAVESLKNRGANLWEIKALALRLGRAGKPDLSIRILTALKGGYLMENLESVVSTYKVMLAWRGKKEAWGYLQGAISEDKKPLVLMILYKDGLAEELLDLIGDPDKSPSEYREFAWLQKLIAWQARDKQPGHFSTSFSNHYQQSNSDPYHLIGKFLLGLISQEQLLKKIQTPKQRCEFAYYLGLAERLKGNFSEATQWYHLCLETMLEKNGEFHWATDELFWWAHLGMRNRHRLLRDDLADYQTASTPNKIE